MFEIEAVSDRDLEIRRKIFSYIFDLYYCMHAYYYRYRKKTLNSKDSLKSFHFMKDSYL